MMLTTQLLAICPYIFMNPGDCWTVFGTGTYMQIESKSGHGSKLSN